MGKSFLIVLFRQLGLITHLFNLININITFLLFLSLGELRQTKDLDDGANYSFND